jgi:hypothetical protein
MTRVGVFWRAKSLRAFWSAGDQGLPLFRVDLLIGQGYARLRTERVFGRNARLGPITPAMYLSARVVSGLEL